MAFSVVGQVGSIITTIVVSILAHGLVEGP